MLVFDNLLVKCRKKLNEKWIKKKEKLSKLIIYIYIDDILGLGWPPHLVTHLNRKEKGWRKRKELESGKRKEKKSDKKGGAFSVTRSR